MLNMINFHLYQSHCTLLLSFPCFPLLYHSISIIPFGLSGTMRRPSKICFLSSQSFLIESYRTLGPCLFHTYSSDSSLLLYSNFNLFQMSTCFPILSHSPNPFLPYLTSLFCLSS